MSLGLSRRVSRKVQGLAFTVLELLVTVAVIAILGALLTPGIIGAKSRADSMRCLNNLRQLGLFVKLYADENEGRLPTAAAFRQVQTNTPNGMPVIQEVLASHVSGSENVFKCPRDKAGFADRGGSSYEWNATLNARILHRIGYDGFQDKNDITFLLRDVERWHSKGRRNAVFADGRASQMDY